MKSEKNSLIEKYFHQESLCDEPAVRNAETKKSIKEHIDNFLFERKKIEELLKEIRKARTLGKLSIEWTSIDLLSEASVEIPLKSCWIRENVLIEVEEFLEEVFSDLFDWPFDLTQRENSKDLLGYRLKDLLKKTEKGTKKVAMKNIYRIMSACWGNTYGYLNHPYDRSLFLEKESWSISFHTIAKECYTPDIIRSIFGELHSEEIRQNIDSISVTMMQFLKLHIEKHLSPGHYLLLNTVKWSVTGIPLQVFRWKRKRNVMKWNEWVWEYMKWPFARWPITDPYSKQSGLERNSEKIRDMQSFLELWIDTLLLWDLYNWHENTYENHVIKEWTTLLLRNAGSKLSESLDG